MTEEEATTLARITERLAKAELLLQRVRDKEQAKHELQGLVLFRAPNSLLEDIRAFLDQRGSKQA